MKDSNVFGNFSDNYDFLKGALEFKKSLESSSINEMQCGKIDVRGLKKFNDGLFKNLIERINLKLGFGLYVSEEDYEKWVKGNESFIFKEFRFDYILVVKEGEFNFFHYGPSGLNEIRPSSFKHNENLSFCEGVYCFNADEHEPVELRKGSSLYKGHYVGKYAECVCDFVTDDDLVKDSGNSKEYVLLTEENVKVNEFKRGV